MKAQLIEYLKQDVRGRYVMEIRVWRVDDRRYPYKLKYALLFMERSSSRKVLMDNHHPKAPHVHIDKDEHEYEFIDLQTLIRDFRNYVFNHFGERI